MVQVITGNLDLKSLSDDERVLLGLSSRKYFTYPEPSEDTFIGRAVMSREDSNDSPTYIFDDSGTTSYYTVTTTTNSSDDGWMNMGSIGVWVSGDTEEEEEE